MPLCLQYLRAPENPDPTFPRAILSPAWSIPTRPCAGTKSVTYSARHGSSPATKASSPRPSIFAPSILPASLWYPCRVAELADAPDHFAGRVAGVSPLNHNVVKLEIGLDRDISYEAGQFMLLEVEGVDGARALSMATFERPARRVTFTVKRIPGGALSAWLGVDISGAAVRLSGPLGKATFEPGDAHDLLVVAGGSGLGPMLSILAREQACGHLARHAGHIFFGVRTADDLYGMDQLAVLAAEFEDSVRLTVVLSDEVAPSAVTAQWPAIRFSEGLVHEAALREQAGAFGDALVYMAGPPPMVDAGLRSLVTEARIPPARIRFDRFS